MSRICLIEDDLDMGVLLKEYLGNYSFEVVCFCEPISALNYLFSEKFSLVILDLGLPKMDGFDVCKKIRQSSDIPIIISSARGNLGDKVAAYEYGADDYLAKPYEPKELIIRINAILRRFDKANKKELIGDFTLDKDKMEIFQEGHLLELTKIEYEILTLFLQNPGKVLSREAICDAVQIPTKERAVDMHISNIRNKIFDPAKEPKYIKSIWGIGYKFIG